MVSLLTRDSIPAILIDDAAYNSSGAKIVLKSISRWAAVLILLAGGYLPLQAQAREHQRNSAHLQQLNSRKVPVVYIGAAREQQKDWAYATRSNGLLVLHLVRGPQHAQMEVSTHASLAWRNVRSSPRHYTAAEYRAKLKAMAALRRTAESREPRRLPAVGDKAPVHYVGAPSEQQRDWAYTTVRTKNLVVVRIMRGPAQRDWGYSPFSSARVPIYYNGPRS
jgi:hypothetical protein